MLRRGRVRRRRTDQLAARTLQIAGLLLIFGSAIFWAFTNRQSALLLGAGVTLATLAWLQRAWNEFQARAPDYLPPPERRASDSREDEDLDDEPHPPGSEQPRRRLHEKRDREDG